MSSQPPPTSTQPQTDETLKIYSSKALPTVKVKLKDSSENRELTINKKDLDPGFFVRLG